TRSPEHPSGRPPKKPYGRNQPPTTTSRARAHRPAAETGAGAGGLTVIRRIVLPDGRGRRRRSRPARPGRAVIAIRSEDSQRLRRPDLLTHAAQGEDVREQIALEPLRRDEKRGKGLSADAAEGERLSLALARLERRKAKLLRKQSRGNGR